MSKRILLLSGYMQSGKDTVGDYLVRRFRFKRYAFADMLKDEVAELYGLDRASLDTQQGKQALMDDGKTVRSILIDHGQMRRAQNKDYWVDKVVDLVATGDERDIVITDWRFPNEYHRFAERLHLSCGVFPVRVDRWTRPPLIDESELALDLFPFDKRLRNHSTFEALYNSVDELLWNTFPILLTDVDEVLLQWLRGFKDHMTDLGHTFDGDRPKKFWDISGWIRDKQGNIIDDAERIKELVLEFNHSPAFENIECYPEAKDLLETARRKGYLVVAISSCTDARQAVDRRMENLKNHFGDLIDWVVCLPLGQDKRNVLSWFPPSVWIDDHLDNVFAGAAVGHRSFLITRNGTVADRVAPEISGCVSSLDELGQYL